MIRKKKQSGFTLIELMIVVAIIGILAVLAIFGVRKYLATSKTAEATNTIGAVNRMAVAAFERESAPAELLVGKSSTSAMHVLCKSSSVVPNAGVAGVKNAKYTADPAAGKDYHVGPAVVDTGWVCLKFEMSEAQYYAYEYGGAPTGGVGSCPTLGTPSTNPAGQDWVACANGDLNGDGTTSKFASGGKLVAGQAVTTTQIAEESPEE